MTMENTQLKLARDRAPRVQISYEVEVGGAIEYKELPFVLGVMGDFSGQPEHPLPRLKERSFLQVDKENFDEVLGGMAPRLNLQVPNRLADDGGLLAVELRFAKLADFEPQKVAAQVEPLRLLLETRMRLADLRNKVAANDHLERLLEEVVKGTEDLLHGAGSPASLGSPEGKGE